MTTIRLLLFHVCLAVLVLGSAMENTSAQIASLATTPAAKPFFQSVDLKDGKPRKMDFSIRTVGSVKGRVFSDAELGSNATEQSGISGVKVSLRSRDPRFSNFLFEQYTDEIGAYRFEDLSPGEYSILIDPKDLPPGFREPREESSIVKVEGMTITKIDIPVTPRREIKGVLYTDKNGNGKYDPNKDVPIQGALLTGGASVAVSDAAGSYKLVDLPAGRISLVVRWPKSSYSTHIHVDLGNGPVLDRTVDLPYLP